MNLIKRLDFVEVKKKEKNSAARQKLLDRLKEAVEEVNLIKEGKLKGRPFQELLDEL